MKSLLVDTASSNTLTGVGKVAGNAGLKHAMTNPEDAYRIDRYQWMRPGDVSDAYNRADMKRSHPVEHRHCVASHYEIGEVEVTVPCT